tara:strand:+ start:56 stop:271 length:216 start_codon:yes stop_codon:yes gene_type:complete
MTCQHCKADNEGGWFYCRSCGLRASAPLYNPSVIVRDSNFATAIRKDLINFKETTIGDDIKSKGGVLDGNV